MISAEIVKLSRRTLARVFKTPVAAEVKEELDFHIEKQTREYQATGMSRDEARPACSRGPIREPLQSRFGPRKDRKEER